MSDGRPLLEDVVERLIAQVRELNARVDALTKRVDRLDSYPRASPDRSEADDNTLEGVFRGSPGTALPAFLSGLALVCFLLVIALVLRTVVDNGLVDQRSGSLVGIGYAVLLLVIGYYQYATGRRWAPVFAICGEVLLFSIVLETTARFRVFSADFAYATLAAALAAVSFLGLRLAAFVTLPVAVLGAGLVGIFVKFPDAQFGHLAGVLLLGIVAAYSISNLKLYRWLTWVEFAIVVFFWTAWTVRLRYSLLHKTESIPASALEWYFPAVGAFVLVYLGMVVWAAVRRGWPFGYFEMTAPALAVGLAYVASKTVAAHGAIENTAVGGVSAAVAGLHFLLAGIVLFGKDNGRRAARSLTAAALVLLGMSLPTLTPDLPFALLTWSCVGLGVGLIGSYGDDRPTRLISYLFQVFVAVVSLGLLRFGGVSDAPAREMATFLILAVVSMAHLLVRPDWARHPASRRWQIIDDKERMRVLLLITATGYLLMASRLVLYAAVVSSGADSQNAFQAGQSILINAFALLLMILGLALVCREMLVLAIVLAAAGALKVFGYDFWFTRGLPLVLSVLSFGLAAAVGSLVWKQWERRLKPDSAQDAS